MAQFSNINLRFLNLVIGLCKRVPGLPSDLLNLGYAVKWIELDFTNSSGEKVKPDIILTSPRLKNTLVFEWKSGASLDKGQLLRYSQLTGQDLIQRAFVDKDSVESFDIVYLCLEENKENILRSIQETGYNFPILTVSENAIQLSSNHFGEQVLDSIFNPGLGIKFSRVPTNFVPLDIESKNWEIAERFIPVLIKYMSQNQTQFSLTSVCKDLIEFWDSLGPATRKQLKGKINTVVQLASEGQFSSFLVRVKQTIIPEPVWEIRNNPISFPVPKRRVQFQKMRALQKEFIESLRTGTRQEILKLGP